MTKKVISLSRKEEKADVRNAMSSLQNINASSVMLHYIISVLLCFTTRMFRRLFTVFHNSDV